MLAVMRGPEKKYLKNFTREKWPSRLKRPTPSGIDFSAVLTHYVKSKCCLLIAQQILRLTLWMFCGELFDQVCIGSLGLNDHFSSLSNRTDQGFSIPTKISVN